MALSACMQAQVQIDLVCYLGWSQSGSGGPSKDQAAVKLESQSCCGAVNPPESQLAPMRALIRAVQTTQEPPEVAG